MALYNVGKRNSKCKIMSLEDIAQAEQELAGFEFREILDIEISLKEYGPEVMARVEEFLGKFPKDIQRSVIIENDESNLKTKDLEQFINLEESLSKENSPLFLEEGFEYHTLTETINAEEQIENFGKKLKSLDASPMEKYMMIYNFLTQKVYQENEKNKHDSRSIVSILNGNNIVCVGYASLMRRLCTEAGIECYTQTCAVKKGDEIEYHANNVVKMKDEKYGVDGLYYADACWDTRGKDVDDHSYSYCLIPLGDKNDLKRVSVILNDDEATSLCYTGEFAKIKEEMYNGEGMEQMGQFGLDLGKSIETDVFNPNIVFDESEFSSKDKRLRAVGRLRNALNKCEIPEDFFSGAKNLPPECDVNYMLALLMEDKVDEDRFYESVKGLLHMKKPQNYWVGSEVAIGSYPNIYEHLNNVETYEKEVGQAPIFDSVERKFDRLQNDRKVQKHLEGLMGDQKPIDYEKMREAIKRSYILEGMSEFDAEVATEVAVGYTKMRTERDFDETANGAFMKEILAERERKKEEEKKRAEELLKAEKDEEELD